MKAIALNQGTDSWREWRRQGVGGSDVAAILGVSPYEDHTRASVFAEKVHGVERDVTGAMYRGTVLEPHGRAAYMARYDCIAKAECVEMDGFPWARVSLDGLCETDVIAETKGLPTAAREQAIRAKMARPVTDADRWILELKAPRWETHDLALSGIVAEVFDVQCQWQLLVTGIERLDFASFNPTERFTPESFPLMGKWREQCDEWLARPKCDRGARPDLLRVWLEEPPARRPPMPAEWLAVHAVEPSAERQSWVMDEAAAFWFEVCEARAALPVKVAEPKRPNVEAEFA